jgi:hypothetical protein
VKLTLLIPILAVAATVPPQVRWKDIGKTSTGNTVLLDPKSVKKAPDGIITATLRVKFEKPIATPKGPITASRTVAMFDCARKLVAVKENTYFHDEAKNSVYEKSVPGKPGYGTTIKGSLPDVAMGHLCTK